MKKIALGITSIILTITIFYSCQKNGNTEKYGDSVTLSQLISGGGEGSFFDNCLILNASQIVNPLDTINSYKIGLTARFGENGTNLNAGQISVNGTNISINSSGIYDFEFADSNFTSGKSLIGNSINISNSGTNEVEARNITVYVPTTMYSYSGGLYFPSGSISRTTSIPLKWRPDPGNVFGEVVLQVYYYASLSKTRDANMPRQIVGLRYQIPDNGLFTIPASDLARFPVGSIVGVSIGRATYTQQVYARTTYKYCMISDTRSLPLDVLP